MLFVWNSIIMMCARARFVWYGSLERTSLISVQFAVYLFLRTATMKKSHSAACEQQPQLLKYFKLDLLLFLFSWFLFYFIFFFACVCVCLFISSIECVSVFFPLILQSVKRIIQNNEPLYGYFITNIHSHAHQNPFILNLRASNTHTHTHTLYTCRFRCINSIQLIGCRNELLSYEKIAFIAKNIL